MDSFPHYKGRLCLLVFLLLFGSWALAQEKTEIKGKIIDYESHEPVPFCAVALSGTSLGAITDANGRYVIKNVPLRNYKIVASHIGYKTRAIDYNPEYPKSSYNLSLEPKVTELESVAIETRGRGRAGRVKRRNMRQFKELIFGKGYNPDLIDITNEEVLDLGLRMHSVIKSTKNYDLNIENRFLGYEISYLNLGFNLSHQFKSFAGYPIFKELEPENDEELALWKKNRQTVYQGSLMHFFKSLINDQVENEGFLANFTNYDPSVQQTREFKKQIEYIRTEATRRSKPNLTINYQEDKNLYEVRFKQVIELFFIDDSGMSSEQSYLKTKQPSIRVFPSGMLRNPLAITVYGELASKGIYHMLPSNYEPDN